MKLAKIGLIIAPLMIIGMAVLLHRKGALSRNAAGVITALTLVISAVMLSLP